MRLHKEIYIMLNLLATKIPSRLPVKYLLNLDTSHWFHDTSATGRQLGQQLLLLSSPT